MSYSAFIAPKEEKKVSQETILKGLVFVVTGEFDGISRDNIEALIKRFGGNFVSAISGKVNYLLVGRVLMDNRPPETSKKYLEAEKRGIKILREADF